MAMARSYGESSLPQKHLWELGPFFGEPLKRKDFLRLRRD
eukprot:CAMPEP_0171968790 /NCGR_PEP_ID=MMETSP0993-20121228/205197_1 /TAXON_ID=483369 /ORGANISM="non described non described, Strain CCMP2098" /LENGTH=39 /DNA_ID= /DNA_START= /DNA_END= /DNA_ORIENTATION=